MAVTTLPVAGLEPGPGETVPTRAGEDAGARPGIDATISQGELVLPIFDDDGVMVRVVVGDQDLD